MIISYAQNFEDVMLWRALKQVEHGFYIDVGANDPVVDSVTQLFYEHGWCGINIEPLVGHYQDLQLTRLRDINLNCAAGAFEGEIKLWECEVRGWASADEKVIAEHMANGHSGQYKTIRQTTLTQVWLKHVHSEVHFLKIDVEGFERSVLEGLDFQRFRPWIVVIEATHPNTTVQVHEQWESLLLDADYLFVYADGLNRFYLADQHSSLADTFRHPPNFFDHFVKAPQTEGNLWAQTILTRAEKALAQAAAAETKIESLLKLISVTDDRANLAEARTTEALTQLASADTKIKNLLKLVSVTDDRANLAEARTTEALTQLASAGARIKNLLELVSVTDDRANLAEARTTEALTELASAEARIKNLINSNAWRATLPLRVVVDDMKRLKLILLRSGPVNRIISYARAFASGVLSKIRIPSSTGLQTAPPEFKIVASGALAKSLDPENDFHDVQPTAHLPPRIRTIYSALIKEWDRLSDISPLSPAQTCNRRHRLAFVSPLPPARSGIADYSAELLPMLARIYDIDVILDQSSFSDTRIESNYGVRDSQWLLQNPTNYDRVLYHFGNSSYHQHMFHLLTQVPGIVVLHDFYLGDVLNYLEAHGADGFACQRSLYKSHGYGTLAKRSVAGQSIVVTEKYPANLEVLQLAQGVIVHSQHSKELAATWYGTNVAKNWSVIALLRKPNQNIDREAARKKLGLQPGEFMVCSFGMMGPSKLNHRLLQSWLNSIMTRNKDCRLVFVGEEHAGEYGAQIRHIIQASGLEHSILITGWTNPDSYAQYLMAADLAVQLRTSSRGETSAAVLDCLNYGLPTIVNAHGAMAELSPTAVWMLADDFHNTDLTQAIDTLWLDEQRRRSLGVQGLDCMLSQHAPDVCADQYSLAIERDYARANLQAQTLTIALTSSKKTGTTEERFIEIAQELARNVQPMNASRQLLIDVSATCRNDLKTGIQRVVRALVWSLIQTPPTGCRIEPVYLTCSSGVWHYCYARKWTSEALGIASGWMADDPVDCDDGDVLLIADFASGMAVEANKSGVFSSLKESGVSIHFFVYDLLPIQMPHCFPPDQFGYSKWLESQTAHADSAICISRSVAKELQSWMDLFGPKRDKALNIDWFHLGADLANSIPTTGLPKNSNQILTALQIAPSFLMVGTIEPRKGYLQTLQAFTQMWQSGLNINLAIVGREGWTNLHNDQRQTIPQIVSLIQMHPELGKRLLWLDDVSDEYLTEIYNNSVCLIAASEGEGFGLPLIEAAQHELPIIARDIPVFREVAGDNAFYFSGPQAEDLSGAVQVWLTLHSENKHPLSLPISTVTWEQSSKRVLEILQLSSCNLGLQVTDNT